MSDETITNLPWLLERVAERLDTLAARVRQAESEGEKFDLSSKAVKEALLHAMATSSVSSSSGDGERLTEELLKLLQRKSDS